MKRLLVILIVSVIGCTSVPRAIPQYGVTETGRVEGNFYKRLKGQLKSRNASLLWANLGYDKFLWSQDGEDPYFRKSLAKFIKPVEFEGGLWQVLIFCDANRCVPGTIRPTVVITDLQHSLVAWQEVEGYLWKAFVEYEGKDAILKIVAPDRLNRQSMYRYSLSRDGIELLNVRPAGTKWREAFEKERGIGGKPTVSGAVE